MSSVLKSLVEILQSDEKTKYEKVYGKVTFLIPKLDEDGIKEFLPSIIECLKRDLKSKDADIASSSVTLFSTLIGNMELPNNFVNDSIAELFPEFILTTADKDSVQRCFEVMFNDFSCQKCVSLIQDAIFKDSKNLISDAIKIEILKYISQLFSDAEWMKTELKMVYVKLLQILLVFAVADNCTVRKTAIDTAHSLLSISSVQSAHIAPIASCLKTNVMPKIKSIYTKNVTQLDEVLTSHCPLFLKIMGVSLRKSSSIINAILAVVEQGFRNASSDIKTAAFKAWDCLINCFSEDLEVLSSSRYMKLLMQPLTSTQTTDALNITRIETLWGLAIKLSSKLPALFSTVCLPIIHCCLGNLDPDRLSRKSLDQSGGLIKSRHSGVGVPGSNNGDGFYSVLQASGYRATPKKASQSPKLHIIGVELLIHMLQPQVEDEQVQIIKKFRMPPLNSALLSAPATFVSHGQLFITVVSEVLCHMNGLAEDLCWLLWKRLHQHVKFHLESNLKKKKRETELFNAYLLAMQNIINAELLSEKLIFNMITSFLDFPDGILSSTFYGGSLNGMHGVPALCLLRLLFSKQLIVKLVPSISEDISDCANKLVLCGFENNVRILLFCQSVIEILQNSILTIQITKYEDPVDMEAISTFVIVIWEKLGYQLNQHILKSQECNQGDSLDHDFSAMYSYLLFPTCLIATNNDFTKMWNQVYKSFLWCASFVTTCKPNEICNRISSNILSQYNEKWSKSIMLALATISQCLVSNAEFNHDKLKKSNRFSALEGTASPASGSNNLPSLQKHTNLAKVAALLEICLSYACEHSFSEMLDVLLQSIAKMFSLIHCNYDICNLFEYFLKSLTKAIIVKIEDKKFMREPLKEILLASGKSFAEDSAGNIAAFSGENLRNFLLECFTQKDRKIKNSAVEFWNLVVVSTDQHDSVCKTLPSDFKSALFPIYKQMGWTCPWKDVELPSSIAVAGPSQDDNFTQSSLPPAQGYGAFGSPLKKHSFLSPKKSPLRYSSPSKVQIKTPTSIKRKLAGVSEQVNFVKCDSPVRKASTPLTEHQKEKMRERGFIPPMYNDLDEKQEKEMVVDTQESIDEIKAENKENTSDNNADKDIIKTSQNLEESTPKKRKTGKPKGQHKISLKSMVSIQEEEEISSVSESPVRRSTRSRSKPSDTSDIEKEKGNKKADYISENENKIEKEEIITAESASDDDSLFGRSKIVAKVNEVSETDHDAMEQTDEDASYEYIEIADASTNQTQGNISIDEEVEADDVKDLGVRPLDDSYEYVAVADMSVNVTAANQSLCAAKYESPLTSVNNETETSENSDHDDDIPKDNGMSISINSTEDESEYEEIAVADMSTAPSNMTMDVSEEKDKTDDKPNPDIKNAEIPSEPNTTNEKITENEKQGEEVRRRSLRLQKTAFIEEEDDEQYMSSDGESEDIESDQKSLNETEYEYVEVADMSAVVDNNVTAIDVDDTDNEKDEKIDEANLSEKHDESKCEGESVCVVSDDDFDETVADDEDEFIDARSSLDANSSQLRGDKVAQGEVIDVSGSSASDMFETSVESTDDTKSVAECSAITIETSESDDEEEKIDESSKDDSAKFTTETIVNNEKPEENKEIKEFNETSPLKKTKIPIVKLPKLDSPVKDDDKSSAHDNENTPAADESPVQSSKSLFKVPAIAMLQEDAALPPGQSPSAKGILKRRITIGPVTLPSPSPNSSKSRRVSFAEPISKSKHMNTMGDAHLQQSPRSSLVHRKKHSPRTVNRRLSLQPEKKAALADEIPVSPLSLRSVRVAEAIANIRAKDPSSPSRLSKLESGKRSVLAEPSAGIENNADFKNISLKDLENSDFVNNLSKSQLKKVISFLLKTTPVLHEALMEAFDT
ncbi:telomere-associated protein RIF1-like [Styela clava]